MPDTEVISCPACRHVVRVPTDWLGTTVQCPECRATFTAPVSENGQLTEPVLLSAPAPARAASTPREGPSYLLPAVGMILVGLVSVGLNGWVLAQFLSADGGTAFLKDRLQLARQLGWVPPAGAGDPAADDDKAAAELAPKVVWVWPAAIGLAGLTVAGGMNLLQRRNPRVAQLGCLAAALNLPGGCCIPGAVFGIWALLLLLNDDGFGGRT